MSVIKTPLMASKVRDSHPACMSFVNPAGVQADGSLHDEGFGQIYRDAGGDITRTGNYMTRPGSQNDMTSPKYPLNDIDVSAQEFVTLFVYDITSAGANQGCSYGWTKGYVGAFVSNPNTAFAISDDGVAEDAFAAPVIDMTTTAAVSLFSDQANAHWGCYHILSGNSTVETLDTQARVNTLGDIEIDSPSSLWWGRQGNTRVYGMALYQFTTANMPADAVIAAALEEVNTNWRAGDYRLPSGFAGIT